MLFLATDEARSDYYWPLQTLHDLQIEFALGRKADIGDPTIPSLICPSGKSRAVLLNHLVQPICEKYFASPLGRSSLSDSAVPPPHEGRFAIVTNVGRGMRWTLERR
jgi:hypothetical protein